MKLKHLNLPVYSSVYNMVRPRKVNKIPMTTIAISEKLLKEMIQVKVSHITWNDFINRIWKERKDALIAIEDYEALLKIKQKRIKELEKMELELHGLV